MATTSLLTHGDDSPIQTLDASTESSALGRLDIFFFQKIIICQGPSVFQLHNRCRGGKREEEEEETCEITTGKSMYSPVIGRHEGKKPQPRMTSIMNEKTEVR